jgi:hypothetical protein
MRIFQTLMMILMTALLAGAPAIPHLCLDDADVIKAEQVVKNASNNHRDSSNSKDKCCLSHHCCFAKLMSPTQSKPQVMSPSKAGLPSIEENRLASFESKGLDRPPKLFA